MRGIFFKVCTSPAPTVRHLCALSDPVLISDIFKKQEKVPPEAGELYKGSKVMLLVTRDEPTSHSAAATQRRLLAHST